MDNVELNYPIIFLSKDIYIRLSAAIIIACIDDGGAISSVEYADNELEPFYNIDPHQLIGMNLSGGLLSNVKTLKKAVLRSIGNKDLKVAFLDVDLNDVINTDNTWIEMDEFYRWCYDRQIVLNDLWSEYREKEYDILNPIRHKMYELRRRAETPDFDNKLEEVRKEFNETMFEDLLSKLAAYRSNGEQERPHKPTGKREGDTLLTIIAALAKDAKLDIKDAGKTALYIEGLTDGLGAHVSKRAIENHLKRIPNALEPRMK